MQPQARFALVGVLLGTAGIASAQMPMVGGAYGQTLRFVIAAGDPIPTESGCSAMVRLLTRDLLPAAEAQFDMEPGEARFLDVDLSRLAGEPGRRVELLPDVTVFRGDCLAAVEVYENRTGRTMAHLAGLLLPASPGLLLPALGPRFAPVGVALGQVLRLGAIHGFDPQPDPPKCRVLLGFADGDGNPVGPSRTVDLDQGESAVLDLDPAMLPPADGDRLRARRFVRPRLLLPAAGDGDLGGCGVSVQVFERRTGRTTLMAFGQ